MTVLGTSEFACSLYPWQDRHTRNMGRVFRADTFMHEFNATLVAHQLTNSTNTSTNILSGYEDALLDYLVVKNLSPDQDVTVEVQLEDYILAATQITIPAGLFMVLRRVNCAVLYPTTVCSAVGQEAELEIFIFASTVAQDWKADYLYWMPGEMQWYKCSSFAPPNRAFMVVGLLGFPWLEQGDSSAGVNTFLPEALREKAPLILHLGFAQLGSPTVAGNAHLYLTVAAYDTDVHQLLQVYGTYLDIPFIGGVAGRELSHVDVDLAPYIGAQHTSLSLIFTRAAGDQEDTLCETVYIYHGRTLQ